MTGVTSIEHFSISANFDAVPNRVHIQEEAADVVSFVYGKPKLPQMLDIAKAFLAEKYPDTKLAAVLGECRIRSLVSIRHHVWWYVRQIRPDVSAAAMGRRFKRDHSTILHGIKKHAAKEKA